LLKTNAPIGAAQQLLETAKRMHYERRENQNLMDKVDTLMSDVTELKKQQQVVLNLLSDFINQSRSNGGASSFSLSATA
jgi:predicted transposase YdaD